MRNALPPLVGVGVSYSARVITTLSAGLENETDDRLGSVCIFYPSSHDSEVRIIKDSSMNRCRNFVIGAPLR